MTMGRLLGGGILGVLLVACGSAGRNGTDGEDGRTSLVQVVPEPPGTHCQYGGTWVKSGLDTNGNENLDANEVTQSSYTCNGASGGDGSRMLVRVDPEPAGVNCAQGGNRVGVGQDVDGNGTLELSEVTTSAYTCNGAPGNSTGTLALVSLDPEPAGANCAQGGTAVRSGLDSNGNGTLDASEVKQTQYVCSGISLYATRWATSPAVSSTGELPAGFWFPSGRKASIFKTTSSSRLKISISDNLAVGNGVNGGSGYYQVRMNGGYVLNADCIQRQLTWNVSGWASLYYFPFATVCLTDPLPAGLYEFETWGYAVAGTEFVGGPMSQPVMLVEELNSASTYGFSMAGGLATTTSTTFQRAPGRTAVYTKQTANTLLKVTLADTFRAGYNSNGGSGYILIRMDGQDTTCSTIQYDAQGTGGDFHHPFVMTCVLSNVAAGDHTFTTWFRSVNGSEAYIGWERPYSLLLVEEISGQNLTYVNAGTASGEISGDWAGVGARQIQHTVGAAGKTLLVTYSDTFRATLNCNGRWGYYQLYVDGLPTYCTNGQYAYNGNAAAAQNHHHSVNQLCLVKNLAPGPHTFSIWSSTKHSDGTTCGSNYFGWNRGQSLLMVEELP